MSGIFGFSMRGNREREKELSILKKWNENYGREAADCVPLAEGGIGCCEDHFSEKVPRCAPVLTVDNRKAVVDALLYNRDELIKASGHSEYASLSDEELLLCLIREKGSRVLAEVNGDFAGAIYEEETQNWTLFRDHLGIRPLFYYKDEHIFAFSTDIRGLAALPGMDMKINEKRFYQHMMGYNDLSLTETEYAHIFCVPPASVMTVHKTENGFSTEIRTYWKLRQNKIRLSGDAAYQTELRRLITDAVKRRLDAVDGLVGAELSGGLDSSVIAILINRLGREQKCFSWSYPPDEFPLKEIDERKIIFDICAQEHISCQFSKMPKNENTEDIYTLLKHQDPSYLNTRNLTEGSAWLRSQGARVVFTGHGGDEGVSHRCNLYELWHYGEYFSFMRAIFRQTKGRKLRILRTVKRAGDHIRKVHPYFRNPYHKQNNCAAFLKDSFCQRMEPEIEKPPLYFAWDPAAYIMQGGTRVRIDNVAVQGADNGMRYMLPFLDYRVIDFAVSIPRSQFQNGRGNRWIYRQAFADMIPQSLREMNYKDTPSMRDDDWHQEDPQKMFRLFREQFLQYLDRRYWEDYLDFDAIAQLSVVKDNSVEEYYRIGGILDELMTCAMMQNIAQMGGTTENE